MKTNLIAKEHRSPYTSKNGNTTFVYAVSGNEESLKAFKDAQGDYYREENGTPLWFTTRFVGERAPLVITSKGRVIADMSEYKKAESLVKQFGGNFGDELARQTIAKLQGKASTPVSAPVPSSTEDVEDAE